LESNSSTLALPESVVDAIFQRDWADKIDYHFDVREYAQIAKEYLWEMSLTVFVRREMLSHVSQVHKGTLACGVAGVAGNKGGICVSLCIHQTSVIFISSHLAAFQNDVENRNRCINSFPFLAEIWFSFERYRDYRSISAGLKVNPLEPGVESCESHHCCIWMGDLNYRIDLKREEVIAAAEQLACTTS
jgi:phosphatidylinositol-bisphosphatase